MDAWNILYDLLVLLASGLILGALAERLKQSALIGYILAGMLVGPQVLAWVEGGEEVRLLSELGAALLLFSIGLEFSIQRLLLQGKRALFAGGGQVALTAIISSGAVFFFGLPVKTAVVIGCAIALSSTACVIKVLRDRAEADSAAGRYAISILLVQDMAVVPLLLLVSALGGKGSALSVLTQLGWTLLSSLATFGVFYVLLNRIVPKFLGKRSSRTNPELPVLLTAVLALGTAFIAHKINLSPAFGAFLAGLFLAESPFATQIRTDVEPLKVLLVTLFFAAIGMYVDPMWIARNPVLVTSTALGILLGKALLTYLTLRLFRVSKSIALGAGIILAQVGEFSFVLLEVATKDNLLGNDLLLLFVSATAITLIATPYLIQFASKQTAPAVKPRKEGEPSAKETPRGNGILIVGFGPAGLEVARLLPVECKSRVTVLDLNAAHAKKAKELGVHYEIGDASRREVLQHVGAKNIGLAIVALPDPNTVKQILKNLRDLAPQARLITRVRYHRFKDEFIHSGADVAVDEEYQVGERLAEAARNALEGRLY